MRMLLAAAGFGLLAIGPVAAQVPNVQQLLQGLTTGNQGQDQALRDAFERGYQKGRQDEAQMRRSGGGNGGGGNDRRGNDRSSRQLPPDNNGNYGNGNNGNGNYGNGDQGNGTYRR